MVAEIFVAAPAIAAGAVGEAQPRDTDPHPNADALNLRAHGFDAADDLVAKHERQLGMAQLPIDDVQIGAADPAGHDLEQHLTWPRLGHGQLGGLERRARRLEHHGLHGCGWHRSTDLPSCPT